MLFRLKCIWFSSITARLARLSRPKGVEMRRQPCIIWVGDRYKVRYYKGEVLITLVLVLNIMPLAVIYIVACIYSKLSGILLQSPQEALRAALGHLSDGYQSRTGGTCP